MCVFLQSDPAAASTSLEGIYCIRSCNNLSLVIVVKERENDPSGQIYLYRIIYYHSQILRISWVYRGPQNALGILST